MARLKFLAFAVVALGLWVYHLTIVAPLALNSAVEQAQAAVAGAAGPVALALESRRSLLQAVGLKLGASSTWTGSKPSIKPEAPSADRLDSMRRVANELVPPELREELFVALTIEGGSLAAKGSKQPTTTVPEGLDFASIQEAGPTGAVRTIDGANYLLLSMPLLVVDKNEVRQAGGAIIGVPFLPEPKVLEQIVKALGLKSLALVSNGKAVVTGGEKSGVEEILSGLKPGGSGALASGPVREVGPMALPVMAGASVQLIGGRQLISGSPFEVAASASSRAAVEGLAAYQVFGFGALGGLLLLAIVLVMAIGESQGRAAMVVAPPMPLPPMAVRREEGVEPPLAMEEPPHAPEASPDDFEFPVSQTSGGRPASQIPPAVTAQAPQYEPEPKAPDEPPSDPFAPSSAQHLPPPVSAPPGADPFAFASPPPAPFEADENGDATRIAAVPAELIRAARGPTGTTGESPSHSSPPVSRPPTFEPGSASASEEDTHFQEVFREFVVTREKCGEPADGLTFDKFKAKLLKSKETLAQKYQCRTVRFQVYVKDAKAALKATPVKD